MKTALIRRFASPLVALLAVLLVAGPAAAEPGEDGGEPPTLREQLDLTARAYTEAKNVLDGSKARQAAIDQNLRELENRLAELQGRLGTTANAAYRGSKFSQNAALIGQETDHMLRGITTVSYLARRDDKQLREYTTARRQYDAERKALDDEIRLQEEQARQMEKRKTEAEKALAAAGGGGVVNGVPVPAPTAKPAPRNANGSWPKESCSADDPTTSSCITPRTLHALQEARLAGFTRHTGCFRPGDRYEHPKGRACDFSAAASGFQNVNATGGDKAYGDRLAGWCVGNANRLGVLYVIWYRQIWHPGTGWRAYRGGGDPASAHTNHVHLSML